MYIKKVVRAPYICTVPGGGVQAIKCYPDAKTFIVNGKKIGYSRREQTMIVPLNISGNEIKIARTLLEML